MSLALRVVVVAVVAALALPLAAKTLAHRAENGVPVVMIEVARIDKVTRVTLRAEEALSRVCWAPGGADSRYLIADGRRYRFLSGDNITACPTTRDYRAQETLTLRFELLDERVRVVSLVEGQGGESQMVDPSSSPNRYWNFLRVPVD